MAPYGQTNLSWLLCRWMRKTALQKSSGRYLEIQTYCFPSAQLKAEGAIISLQGLNISFTLIHKFLRPGEHVHWKNTPGFIGHIPQYQRTCAGLQQDVMV